MDHGLVPLRLGRAGDAERNGGECENEALHGDAPFNSVCFHPKRITNPVIPSAGEPEAPNSHLHTQSPGTSRNPNDVSNCPSPSKSYLIATVFPRTTPVNLSP